MFQWAINSIHQTAGLFARTKHESNVSGWIIVRCNCLQMRDNCAAWSGGEVNSIRALEQFSSFSIFRSPAGCQNARSFTYVMKKSALVAKGAERIEARWLSWRAPHRHAAHLLKSALLHPTVPVFHHSKLNFAKKLLSALAFQPAIRVKMLNYSFRCFIQLIPYRCYRK